MDKELIEKIFTDKEIKYINIDRFLMLGAEIASLREKQGLTQEQLATAAGISVDLLKAIESSASTQNFSLEDFFNIADALMVLPDKLIRDALISLYPICYV